MKEARKKVLILATSRLTRGGITSVVKAHNKGEQWQEYNCKWIETHIDKYIGYKLLYFLRSFFHFICIVPFYNLVHIHVSEPPSAIRKLLFMIIAKLFNKKVLIHFHSFSIETTINSKYHKIYKYLFCNADIVVVLSAYWQNELEKKFKIGSKVKVLYNPCERPTNKILAAKKMQILFAGTLNERKGYKDLINAFSLIATKNREWQLILAGNGEIQQGELLAKELGIENQVQFLGWINGDTKEKVFQEASIFCLPSYAEGFPMAVLDAWANGLPVICTPVGGLPDIIKNGENALVFEAGNINKLAEHLEKLISDVQLRNTLSNESNILSKTIFNRDVINSQLSNIYKELLTIR